MTPEIRFPGFTGDWHKKRLGDLSIKVGSGSTPRGGSAVYKRSGIPFIRSQNVARGNLNLTDVAFIDERTHASMGNSKIMPNDLLLNITGASLGRTCVVPSDFDEGNVSQHVCIIRLRANVNPFLVHTIFSKPKSLHELLKMQTGGGKEGLNFQAVRAFKVTLPDTDEQRKIAEFLTLIDKKMAVTDRKIILLKQYKKTVMQKIFAQQIRFKDENGDDYSDWRELKLGEVYTFIRTNSLSRDALGNQPGIKNIHYGDIHTKLPLQLDIANYDLPTIKDGMSFSNEDYCRTGDLVIADASEDYADIGKCIEIQNTHENEAVAGLHTLLLRPNNLIQQGFGGYMFQSIDVRRQVTKMATGVSVLGISKGSISKLSLQLPSIPEQTKIAQFLNTLDETIGVETTRLSQTKKFKKSLLQKMFV